MSIYIYKHLHIYTYTYEIDSIYMYLYIKPKETWELETKEINSCNIYQLQDMYFKNIKNYHNFKNIIYTTIERE